MGDAILQIMAKPDSFGGKAVECLIMVARRRMIDAVRSPRSKLLPLEADIVDRQPSVSLEQEAAEVRKLMIKRGRISPNNMSSSFVAWGAVCPKLPR